MKPQSFEYVRAGTLDSALEILADAGDEAKVIAGGQSLVPVMNLRLARPAVLVDINPLAELARVEQRSGALRLGALVRHRTLERGEVGGALGGLLAEVAGHIGHVPVRVRGSIGGSLAHADPGAEWCLVALALEAEVEIARRGERRRLTVDAFLDGPFTTALAPDELVLGLELARRPGWSYGFAEHARTHGAFAQSGACVALQVRDEVVAAARVAVMGVGGRAERLGPVEAAVVGRPANGAAAAAAGACREVVDPAGYDEVSPDYLRALAAAVVRRATAAAIAAPTEERQ